jgi:predicted secreted protein
MTTEAKIGRGNKFQLFDTNASPPAWTTVAEVKNITPPAYARDTQEATHTESPDGYREFVSGLRDAGEISVELNFVPDSDTTDMVFASFDSDELQQVRILFRDGSQSGPSPTCSKFTASGFITGFTTEGPLDDVMSGTVNFKISGKPTFVRASA